MWKCNDCECEFEEPKSIEEYRGEFWGSPCWETLTVCPNCDSEDFDEINEDDEDEEIDEADE